MERITKLGMITLGAGALVAVPGVANAASAGETCKLAMAQLLYRPSTDFHSSSISETKGRVTFQSSFDQSERSIECERQGDKLTWIVLGETWRRQRNNPIDERIEIRTSGVADITYSYAPVGKWSPDLVISPPSTTYLVKMIIANGVSETLALSWVNSVVGTLTKTGGTKDQAFHCAYWGGKLLANKAMNYEIVKLDLEECYPGAVRAIASGAGVSGEEIVQMILTNRLASKNSLLQLSEVYKSRTMEYGGRVYSDYQSYKDKVAYP